MRGRPGTGELPTDASWNPFPKSWWHSGRWVWVKSWTASCLGKKRLTNLSHVLAQTPEHSLELPISYPQSEAGFVTIFFFLSIVDLQCCVCFRCTSKWFDLFKLFIYFWLHWVFIAACGLSLIAASGGYSRAAMRGLPTEGASLVAAHRL